MLYINEKIIKQTASYVTMSAPPVAQIAHTNYIR